MRQDSTTGDWYACSAHFLWVGERTRGLDGAHVAFLEGVHNPVGAKIGPSATPDEVVALAERLNPERIPGRLTLITRLGADHVEELLPPLLTAVRESGVPVLWVCDPMHANTFVTGGGHKTRRFDVVMQEIEGFFAAHRSVGTWPGGVHLEITGENVTECLGGCRGRERGAARPSLRDALRPAPQRAPVARPRLPRRRAHARFLTPCGRQEPRVEGRWLARDRHLAVIGTGLIGASAALAAREAGVARVRAGIPTRRRSPSRRSAARSTRRRALAGRARGRRARARRRARGRAARAGAARCSTRRPTTASSRTSARPRARSSRSPSPTAASSAVTRSAVPRRGAPERATADLFDGRDLVPDAGAVDASRALQARPRLRRLAAAPGRSRSTPERTTASWRSRATCRTPSRTCSSTRRARRAWTVTTRCRLPGGRSAT